MGLSELITVYGDKYLKAIVETYSMTAICFCIAMVISILVTVMRVSPIKPLRIVGDLYVQIFRNIPGVALLIAAMLGALFTTLVGNTLTLGRLLFAMQRDGILPKWFGRVNRNGAPSNAVLFVIGVSMVAATTAFCMTVACGPAGEACWPTGWPQAAQAVSHSVISSGLGMTDAWQEKSWPRLVP